MAWLEGFQSFFSEVSQFIGEARKSELPIIPSIGAHSTTSADLECSLVCAVSVPMNGLNQMLYIICMGIAVCACAGRQIIQQLLRNFILLLIINMHSTTPNLKMVTLAFNQKEPFLDHKLQS